MDKVHGVQRFQPASSALRMAHFTWGG